MVKKVIKLFEQKCTEETCSEPRGEKVYLQALWHRKVAGGSERRLTNVHEKHGAVFT